MNIKLLKKLTNLINTFVNYMLELKHGTE